MWEIGGEKFSLFLQLTLIQDIVSDFLRKPGLVQGLIWFQNSKSWWRDPVFWHQRMTSKNFKITLENATIDELGAVLSYQNQNLDIKADMVVI